MTTLDPKKPAAWESFLDALRPPPGYDLEQGIGTTYGLSLELLMSALLGFVNVDGEMSEDLTSTMLALMRVSERLRVFVHRGFDLDLTRGVPELFGLLDRIVRDVSLPVTSVRQPSFHPKVWVLAFLRRDRLELRGDPERRYRLLCTSKNLTASSGWELGLRLEGAEDGEPSAVARDAGKFLMELAKRAPRDAAILHALAGQLHGVRFTSRAGELRDLRLHACWPGSAPLTDQLPAKGKRALIVSPFLRADFLDIVASRFDELTIVSNQDQLDRLKRPLHPKVQSAEKYVVTTEEASDIDFKLDGLHAKLVICEGRRGESVSFQGSANATGAAWGRSGSSAASREAQNCEVMISMRPGLSIKNFRKQFIHNEGENKTLHPWLVPYEAQPVSETEEERSRERLRDWLSNVTRLSFHQAYKSNSQRLQVFATGDLSPAPKDVPNAMVHAVPLLLQQRADGFRACADVVASGGALYENVPRFALSEFVLLRAKAPDVDPVTCIVLAPCEDGSFAGRDVELQQRLLERGDPSRLLEAILFGSNPARQQSSVDGRSGETDSDASRRARRDWITGLTVERLLEACVERPTVGDEIEAWLDICPPDKVPAAFRELWESFRAAGLVAGKG